MYNYNDKFSAVKCIKNTTPIDYMDEKNKINEREENVFFVKGLVERIKEEIQRGEFGCWGC